MSKRLLLADDSITIQKVIQITFAHEDYELTITDNGDSAFARARELVPDMVLADVYMPGKNGYELCAAIKQEPALRHIPVLLLAGSFEPFDEGKARASGAEAWIEKPFESQALIDKVAALLSAASAAAAPSPAVAPAPSIPGPVAEPAPAMTDPFADVSFEEPAAAAVPPAAMAATPDDWSDLNEKLAAPVAETEPAGFAFEEPPPAPSFEFSPEPFTPMGEEPLAFEESVSTSAGFDVFADADEVMALGDDDILGAEDLEPAGEVPTLTPWSREELPVEEPFEAFAEPDPFAPAPVAIEPVAVPAPAESPPFVAEPVPEPQEASAPAEVTPAAAAVVEQRVATLTEAEIERIVERAVGKVIEKLAGSVLEKVAWEVVPDLAEALIKEEIRKIKDAAA
jgi:CheY-like chemotaxis protein